jgi:hypothetical protein
MYLISPATPLREANQITVLALLKDLPGTIH